MSPRNKDTDKGEISIYVESFPQLCAYSIYEPEIKIDFGVLDTLHVLVTFPSKALIWLSTVSGNTNKVAYFASCYESLVKIEAYIKIIFNYTILGDF